MKKVFLFIALLTFSINIAAAPIKGAGALSCGSWIKERHNGTYHMELNWILGFISAYNTYIYNGSHSNGVFGSADPEAVAAWMDNYCRENPLSSPYEGSIELIEKLLEMRN